jgi:multidrug efflux pump
VQRGLVDPPVTTMRFKGREAIGLAVSMKSNGDVLRLGQNLKRTMGRLKSELPVGRRIRAGLDQPSVVRGAVGEFMRSLREAVRIVMAISFLALGMRTGSWWR